MILNPQPDHTNLGLPADKPEGDVARVTAWLFSFRDDEHDYCDEDAEIALRLLESQAARIATMESENASLRAKLDEAEGAWRFVAAVFQAYDDSGWGCDIDGSDIQEWGVKFGLLDEINMADSADETDRCHNCTGDCDTCYRFKGPLQVRVDAARQSAQAPSNPSPKG